MSGERGKLPQLISYKNTSIVVIHSKLQICSSPVLKSWDRDRRATVPYMQKTFDLRRRGWGQIVIDKVKKIFVPVLVFKRRLDVCFFIFHVNKYV